MPQTGTDQTRLERQQPLVTQLHGMFDGVVVPPQREPSAQIPQMPSQKPAHCVPGAVT